MHVLIFLINVAAGLDNKEYKIYVKNKTKTKQHKKKTKNNYYSYFVLESFHLPTSRLVIKNQLYCVSLSKGWIYTTVIHCITCIYDSNGVFFQTYKYTFFITTKQ